MQPNLPYLDRYKRIRITCYCLFVKTFDVVISNEPTNIAYTSSELLLHMDQGYYESTPGIQLLHCIK